MKYYKIIDEETVFFTGKSIVLNGGTIINPTHEQMLEAGWLVYVEPEPSDEEKLQNAKIEKLRQIEEYDASDNVNQFTIQGSPMWLDHNTRQQLKTSIEAYAAMGNETVSKWFGGIEFTFSVSQWLQMLVALEVYASEALNVTEHHKAIVSSLTTIQEVMDYNYTEDYPEKLDF